MCALRRSQTETPPSMTSTDGWDLLTFNQLTNLNRTVGRMEGMLETALDTQKAQGQHLTAHDREIEKLKAAQAAKAPKARRGPLAKLQENILALVAVIYAAVLLFYLLTGQIERANQLISSGASRQISEGR